MDNGSYPNLPIERVALWPQYHGIPRNYLSPFTNYGCKLNHEFLAFMKYIFAVDFNRKMISKDLSSNTKHGVLFRICNCNLMS